MLTTRQEEILDFIRAYQREQGVPASARVIQRRFDFGSHTSALKHLRALAAKGAVTQLADGSWGVRAREIQSLIDLPVLGAIPAGVPDERQQEEAAEKVAVDPTVFGVSTARLSKLWALRVTGDSMVGAHICDGDIGIFERREALPGDIIAALVDNTTTTLKRLVELGGRSVLRAENPSYKDIVPSEAMACQGVLVGVIRRVATVG